MPTPGAGAGGGDRHPLRARPRFSGRRALDARGILGLDSLAYVGNHGYECCRRGRDAGARARAHRARARCPRFLAAYGSGPLEAAGVRVEDKGAIVALHWRGAPTRQKPKRGRGLAAEAEEADLIVHAAARWWSCGPPVDTDKGRGSTGLLERGGLAAALYAGDDRTDVDAFKALRRLVAADAPARGRGGGPRRRGASRGGGRGRSHRRGPEGFVGVLEALA